MAQFGGGLAIVLFGCWYWVIVVVCMFICVLIWSEGTLRLRCCCLPMSRLLSSVVPCLSRDGALQPAYSLFSYVV